MYHFICALCDGKVSIKALTSPARTVILYKSLFDSNSQILGREGVTLVAALTNHRALRGNNSAQTPYSHAT